MIHLPHSFIRRFICHTAAVFLAAGLGLVQAQTIEDAKNDLLARKYEQAATKLTALSTAGNAQAKGLLAEMHARGVGVPKDLNAGCKLAQEADAGSDARGTAVLAGCVLDANIKTSDRFGEAFKLAIKSAQQGDELGALTAYAAYMANPAHQYIEAGKPNRDKYFKLAKRTVEQRQEQIVALNGLGYAFSKGVPTSHRFMIAHLASSSAPGNNRKLMVLAQGLKERGIQEPMVLELAQSAFVRSIEASHVSVEAYKDVFLSAAMVAATAGGTKPEQACKDWQLTAVDAQTPQNAVYLPHANRTSFLASSLMLSGSWTEKWTLVGCGRTENINITLTADSMGGVAHTIKFAQ
jgi:uncharacterized protein